MADDSNKNPPNIGWKAALADIAREAKSHTQSMNQDRSDMNTLRSVLELPEDLLVKLKGRVPSHTDAAIRMPKIQQRITNTNITKRSALNSQFERVIGSEFNSATMNGIISDLKYTPEVSAASAAMGSLPHSQLMEMQKTHQNGIQILGGEAKAFARNAITGQTMSNPSNAGNPNSIAGIENTMQKRDQSAITMAAISQQMEFRKSQGQDPKSQEMMASKYYGIAKQQQLEAEIRKDKSVNFTDPTTGEAKSIKLGANIVKELEDQIKGIADNFKKLETATKEEAEALKSNSAARTEIIQKLEVGKEVGGGGSFGGFTEKQWQKGASWAAAIGMAGDATKTIAVDHRIAERANEAGMAGLVNQKYQTYKAARGGDIASQMLLAQYGKSQEFGESVKGWGLGAEAASKFGWATVKGLGAAATGAAAAGVAGATGLAATTGIGALLAPLGISGTAALTTASVGLGLSAAKDVAEGVSSVSRGVESGQNYIRGVSTDLEARKQVNAIPAEQMQGLRDFYVGAGTVSMGMGSKGEGFLKQMTDAGDSTDVRMMKARNGDTVNKGMLENMADAGISPEQMVQMADLGNKTLGSQFSADQVFTGRKYEKAGFGSMQENMQRMGQLSAAGSNNPQAGLESVMASAMTKGLDNSKALGMMVDNTAALVAVGTGGSRGIDTAGVVAAQLASMVDKGSPTLEYDLSRAKNATDIARSADTNTSSTFSGFMNTSRVQEATGLEGVEAINAGKTDVSQWKKMQDMAKSGKAEDLQKAGEYARARGMNIKNEDILDTSTKMIDLKQRQIAEGAGTANALIGGITDEQFEQLKGADIKDGDKNYSALSQVARTAGYDTVQQYQKAIKSADVSADPNSKAEFDKKTAGTGGETLQEQMDFLRTDGFSQLSEAAQSAATALKNVGGAVAEFTRMQKESKGAGGAETEKEFAGAGGEAAKNFKMGADTFGTHVDTLGKILSSYTGKPNMYIPPAPDPLPQSTGGARRASGITQ